MCLLGCFTYDTLVGDLLGRCGLDIDLFYFTFLFVASFFVCLLNGGEVSYYAIINEIANLGHTDRTRHIWSHVVEGRETVNIGPLLWRSRVHVIIYL